MPEVKLIELPTLLARADASRKIVNGKLNLETKTAFGQYMTPAAVASFMASLFPLQPETKVRLLDPGAGVGSLTSAFVAHLNESSLPYEIDVDAYEIDPVMRPYLKKNLALCKVSTEQRGGSLSWQIISDDFIIDASKHISSTGGLWAEEIKKYTHCIMNPPYKKISSASRHRGCLHSVGIETVNLYPAFVALSLSLMETGGCLVAIIPRSFCNGPYYRPFREFVLERSAVLRIHLFTSRNKAFKEDNVLQENIIIMLERGGEQHEVTVSTSTDANFTDIATAVYPFDHIVRTNDPEIFIHIPISPGKDFIDISKSIRLSLDDLGIQVSTGPVVDFRLKEHLRNMPGKNTVPLLYPCHFSRQSIEWPQARGKKPNAVLLNHETKRWLYPNDFYTVVRRFSSKEEKRRIVASVVDPGVFQGAELIGFENHLNVFHEGRKGLPEVLAKGLAVFLNSTVVDDNFRRFSGHTQVNATDLKLMKYPGREDLTELGKWAMRQDDLTQGMIDEQVEKISE
ncbi:MAG: Eco57I restriction-modification methylase domain-containing protein [Nitrospirae bacterium]|nr:Eco57I restriction-modification methylase domain-containing protein [Nitrospirota bacterium]